MFVPKMILTEATKNKRGSKVMNKKGVVFECTHYDSRDTILKNLATGNSKIVKTMTLHRYYNLVKKEIRKTITRVDRKYFSSSVLKYYQASSEINKETKKLLFYEVFFSKEKCEACFSGEVEELLGVDIELPSFVDIPTVEISDRFVAEAFFHFSKNRVDTADMIDDNDEPLVESSYVISIHEEENIPSIKAVCERLYALSGENEDSDGTKEVARVYLKMKKLEKEGVGAIALLWKD